MKKQPKHTTKNQLFTNLEKFQSIDVDGDWNFVKHRIGFRKGRRITSVWRAAAIVILLLGVGFLAKQYVLDPRAAIIVLTGEELKEILLPDGSQVFLNKHTELIYPEKFRKKNRQVKLNGEGFFEVTRDPAKPFVVNVADLASVEVLGTSFNIHAPEEGKSVIVQVVEGKVAFYAIENTDVRELLEKDDQAEMHCGVITMNTRTDMNFLSWKTGVIYFDQVEITSVIDILSNHYNRKMILDSSVDKQLTFTSTIENEDIESVLEEMCLVLEISFAIEDQWISIYKSD